MSSRPNRMGDALQGARNVTRSKGMADAIGVDQEPRASKRSNVRGVLIAAALATLAVIAYPIIEVRLPQSWRSQITAVTDSLPITDDSGTSNAAPAPSSSVAVVLRDLNVRADPSTGAKVIATLPQGLKVTTIEKRGAWTSVQIESDNPNAKPLQGWVYGSFLKVEAGEREAARTAK